MVPKRELTREEEIRCLEFLRILRITDPTHRVLSDRGFFGLYLTGLTPEEVDRSAPPAIQEFRETIRLLCLAGVEKLKQLVAEEQERRRAATPPPSSSSKAVPKLTPVTALPPASSTAVPKLNVSAPTGGGLPRPAIVPVQLGKADPLKPTAPSPRMTPLPPQGGRQTTGFSTSDGTPPPTSAPVTPTQAPADPPAAAPVLTRSALLSYSPTGKSDTRATANSSEFNLRPSVGKPIQAVRPSHDELAKLSHIPHATTTAQAIAQANEAVSRREFHDAYHALIDYLLSHPLNSEILQAATDVVYLASKWNRARNIAPTNMLHECEEMAAVLSRRIPDMTKLCESDNDETTRLYRYAKMVYFTWAGHCHSLLEYKYRQTDEIWMRRNWVEPRDFGFLLDVMKMGIRSRLPLDLLRTIFAELRKCIDVGKHVIAQADKRAKFEGDVLRIVASPVKDEVPDLAFEIYREIAKAYGVEGDSASAQMFCKQALLLHPHDAEMLLLKTVLETKGVKKATM